MKKILIVITTGFESTGGLTTVMMNYYRNIDKEGLIIDFASTNVASDLLIDELAQHNSKYYNLGSKKKNPFGYIVNLIKVLKNNKYDAIHVNGNSATMVIELLIAKLCRVKNCIAHGHAAHSDYPALHKVLAPLFKFSYTTAIAVSKKTGDWLYEKDYIILNNAIDVDHYEFSEQSRNEIREQLNLGDKFVVGNVGKLDPAKNHPFLIKVFKEIHEQDENTMLVIAGGGSCEASLKQLCKELGIEDSVIFLGMVNDTSKVLSAFDVFAFTSIFEGLGMALIEAQASGLQCVCSDTVPRETEVTNYVEYISLNADINQWVEQIMKCKNTDRDRLSDEAKISITKSGYNIKEEAHKLRNIYLEK